MPDNHNSSLVPVNGKPGLTQFRSYPKRPNEFESAGLEIYSSLHSYRYVIVKHRWLIISVAVGLTMLMTIYSAMMKPEYRSTARILVETESPDLPTSSEVIHTAPADDFTFLSTQLNVLQSDNLAWQTIEQLQLSGTAEFDKYTGNNDGSHSAAVNKTQLIELFKDRLTVERKRDTRMIEVSFDSINPQVAARVANALVHNYIEYNFRMKYDATRQTTGWINQQLDELKNKVETSQQALVEYERKNSIVNVGGKETVTEEKLADLSRDLTQAQTERMDKQAHLGPEAEVVTENDVLQKLEERDADLREQYVEALQQYGEAFPKVVRIRAQLDQLQALIDKENKRAAGRLRNDFAASEARESLLAKAVSEQKAQVERVHQFLVQHNILQRDFETNQQIYQNLLQRLKDATVSAGLRATNIHMVDEATAMPYPVRPQKLRNSFLGFLAGLILGFMAAIAKEAFDNSIKTAEEVEILLGTPALAIIPSQASNRAYGYAYGYLRTVMEMNTKERLERLSLESEATNAQKASKNVALAVLNHPRSAISESFRALRTSILLSTAEHAPKVILVTSAQPREGKTSISLNLAVTLAQKGHRVLIIDADFRRPGLASALRLQNDKGLSNVLTGVHSIESCTSKIDGVENLWVLPTGPCPPNPSDLLSSSAMEHLLRTAGQDYDQVIIDSPPVLLITDATVLSTMVDGVIIVVENARTSRGALVRAYRTLTNSGGRILGTALNKVDAHRDSSYYGHYAQSGYFAPGIDSIHQRS